MHRSLNLREDVPGRKTTRGTSSVRCVLTAFAVLLSACGSWAVADGGVDPLAGLPEFLDQLRQDYEVPGVAVVVVGLTPEPAFFTSGHRSLDDSRPITPDTLFHVASVTKTFNGTLAAQLVGEGRLAWDTRVKEVIPEFEVADPVTTERATLRDLLSHRVGFTRDSIPSINLDQSPEWWLPRLKLLTPASEFRDQVHYSGLMVTISGIMLARAADTPWPELLRTRLLEPLGMDRTTVSPPSITDGDWAVGHVEQEGAPVPAPVVNQSVEVAQSGLYSSARDLGRWLQFLIDDAMVHGTRLVDAASLHETWTPQAVLRVHGGPGNAEVRANGLGWMVWSRYGSRWLSHAGGGVGYGAQLTFLPDRGIGVAVLSNRSINPIPDLVSTRVLYGALGHEMEYPRERALAMVERMIAFRREQKAAMQAERTEGAEPPLPLVSYVGRYTDFLYGDVEVGVDQGGLSFTFHGLPLQVTHLHDQEFLLWSPLFDGIRAHFESGPEGRVTALKLALDTASDGVVFTRSQ